MQVMLLAAGLGSRLSPLTDYLPKPLFNVLNEPNLKRLLLQLEANGATKVVINTFHLASMVAYAIKTWNISLNIDVIVEKQLLGTGGGIKNAINFFEPSEPILLINSDVVTDIPLEAFFMIHRHEAAATMLLHDCKLFNNVCTDGNRVTGFGCNNSPTALAYTGICVLSPHILSDFLRFSASVFSLVDVFQKAMADGKNIACCLAESLKSDYIWYDIGTREGYLAAHACLLKKKNEFFISATDSVKDAVLSGKLALEDWTVIGSNVVFGKQVRLRRSVIWDNVEVPDNFFAEDTILTPHGRFAR